MTQQKHLKQLVRARMEKTGESYSAARRIITAQTAIDAAPATPHFAGNVPAATALRIVLTDARIVSPSGRPFSEAMTFGLAGGIGIGVFSFFYEKANFASFFLAGRHLWHDFEAYFTRAAKRLGADVIVKEASGVKPAEKHLRELLAEHGACIVWVDASRLPHRALPAESDGSAYHVITVYDIDDENGTACIGDLTDEPITIPLSVLAAARSRIKKDRNRVLAVKAAKKQAALPDAVADALRACHDGLEGDGAPGNARKSFSLEALNVWAERLRQDGGKESWSQVFAPPRLWRGLTSIYDCIEHSFGTGGGLMRPLFAEFLEEAAQVLKQKPLGQLAAVYKELGVQWSELADAALPKDIPLFREARELYARRAELVSSATPVDTKELGSVYESLAALQQKAAERFPLSNADCVSLRTALAGRVSALYEAEIATLNRLGSRE